MTALKGKVTNVTVSTPGDKVTGSLSGGGAKWHSDGTLNVGQTYTVTANGVAPSGEKITTTASSQDADPGADVHDPHLRGL